VAGSIEEIESGHAAAMGILATVLRLARELRLARASLLHAALCHELAELAKDFYQYLYEDHFLLFPKASALEMAERPAVLTV
jgi:hypothetical protein